MRNAVDGSRPEGRCLRPFLVIEHRRAGLSWAKVADKLNATGHRTRTGGRWTRQGAHQVHYAQAGARRRRVTGAEHGAIAKYL